jgi:tetratricopeptide (TPR) repeat protein
MWGFAGDVSNIHLDTLDDTSKPFHVVYHYHKDNYFVVPNAGASFRILPAMQLSRVRKVNLKKSMEPLDVGPPRDAVYKTHIRFPANYSVQVPGAVAITRDYGDYSVSHQLNKNMLDEERRVVLKVNELPASRRNDYESFENVISSEVEQILSCSIAPASVAGLASAAKTTGTPEAMRKAGKSALERKDFSAAVTLLKSALDQDSNQKDAWEDLGRAYAALSQHEEAIRAFRKQLDLDAFHKSANQDLASELRHQGKFDDAIAAYRKQLEVTPFNKSTHENLGLLLSEVKNDTEARAELEAAVSLPPDDPEAKVELARLYGRTGEPVKADALMKSIMGVSAAAFGSDVYSSALRDNIDPSQTLQDARKTLEDIGDQFDSGEYDRLGPETFRSMNIVALSWARIGWAKFLQGESLEAMQFLNASWLLSQSGTVGNRLARVLEKQGQHEKARHMFSLAVAAGGENVSSSREQLLKFSASSDSVDKEVAQANVELLQMQTIKLSGLASGSGSAQFALVFDSSDKPGRADWLEGDANFRSAAENLREKEYPVRFPDVSSVKIVRKATLSCDRGTCAVALLPLEGLQMGQKMAETNPAQNR